MKQIKNYDDEEYENGENEEDEDYLDLNGDVVKFKINFLVSRIGSFRPEFR